jgi:hypothetical protein
MTDERRPDIRDVQRRAVYDFNIQHAALARRAQSDAGRWLLTALLLVHLAGLLLLAGAQGPEALMRTSAQWALILGAGCALLAGLMAWINWTATAVVHTEWADVRLLDPDGPDEIEGPRLKKAAANASYLLAIVFSLLSLFALPLAALLLG